jgi:hypothetical protein
VRWVPQLSAACSEPQSLTSREQSVASDSGAQVPVPHTFAVPPPPQDLVPVHVPQLATVRWVPQLSEACGEPQFLPSREQSIASASGVQVPAPHTFAVPPPLQTCVPEQVPHSTVRVLPQLSEARSEPQFLPCRPQISESDSGVQVELLPPSSRPPPAVMVHPPRAAIDQIATRDRFTVAVCMTFHP